MEYKDPKSNEVLYGYSERDLTKLAEEIKKFRHITYALVVVLILFLILGIALVRYIDYHNILTNTARLIGGLG